MSTQEGVRKVLSARERCIRGENIGFVALFSFFFFKNRFSFLDIKSLRKALKVLRKEFNANLKSLQSPVHSSDSLQDIIVKTKKNISSFSVLHLMQYNIQRSVANL